MSGKVMIGEADVDALGTLASALRARGLAVSIASEVFDAVEQAYQKKPHVLLAAKELDREGDLTAALSAVPSLVGLPGVYLVDPSTKKPLGPREIKRTCVDRSASFLRGVPLRDRVVVARCEPLSPSSMRTVIMSPRARARGSETQDASALYSEPGDRCCGAVAPSPRLSPRAFCG